MVLVLAAGCGAQAAAPPPANTPTAAARVWSCPTAPRVTIDPRPEPPDICNGNDLGEKCDTVWRGDLDGDGHQDRIVRIEEACGTGGCEFGVLDACPDGSYALLWLDYAVTVSVGEPVGTWRTVVLEEETGTPELRATTTYTLHFANGVYR